MILADIDPAHAQRGGSATARASVNAGDRTYAPAITEADLRTRVQSLEEAVKMYHGYAEGLKLVPASARNARGEDLSIDVDIRAKKREGLLRTEVRNHVLPILQQMKAEQEANIEHLRKNVKHVRGLIYPSQA